MACSAAAPTESGGPTGSSGSNFSSAVLRRPLIIATATAMELRAVAAGLGCDASLPGIGGSVRVSCAGRVFVLAVTGIGPLLAALAAPRLLEMVPAGILCLGIAGTYDTALAPLGSLVAAEREIWPEYGLVTETGVDAKALGFPLIGAKGDTDPPPVWDTLDLEPEKAFPAMGLALPDAELGGLALRWGGMTTVAGVSATPGRARELAARYTPLAENMEGFALALAARRAGIPFGELRSISNIVGERGPGAWNMDAALSALTQAAAALFPEPCRGNPC